MTTQRSAKYLLLIYIYLFVSSLFANDSIPIIWKAQYKADVISSLHGGVKQATGYLGMAAIELEVDAHKLIGWKGGVLKINLANTHGDTPSENWIGDYQGASNIEAGNRTFFQELWLAQQVGRLNIKLGIQDLNAEFSGNDYGSLFINSSFGIHSTFTDDAPVPIFPVMGFGIVANLLTPKGNSFKLGVYDGNPETLVFHPAVYRLPFSNYSGTLLITEYAVNKGFVKNMEGSFKIGAYYHHIHTSELDHTAFRNDIGFYFVQNQQILKVTNNRYLNSMIQFAASPSQVGKNHLHLGFGLIYRGLLSSQGNDEIGLGLSHAKFKQSPSPSENVFELTYKLTFRKRIFIQPNIQYITNPSRFETSLPDALVAILRFGFVFP